MTHFNSLKVRTCFFSCFSFFALMFSNNYLSNNTDNIVNLIIISYYMVLSCLFYKSFTNTIDNCSFYSIVIGICAALINICGKSFMLYNSMEYFHYLKNNFMVAGFVLLAAIGYGLIYACVFEWGWKVLTGPVKRKTNFYDTFGFIVFDKHPHLYPFLLICIFWFPYFIIFFPGMLQWDAMYALRSYYGIEIWTTHHPVIGVLLMGYIMDIGKFLGNDNYGCVIYIVLQFFLFSFTLAYNFVFFNRWKVCYLIRWMILLFFSIHPMFPTFVMNVVKDIFYCIAILWLLFFFIKCYENYKKKYFFSILFFSMLVCALRKEGIIICIFCSLGLIFFRQAVYEKWKNVLIAVLLGSSLAIMASNILINYYNIKPSSIREALSIPIQQTARYVRDHSEDISKTEWTVLNSVFQNHAKELGVYYQPEKSDAVKDLMVYDLTNAQKIEYISVWINQFFRHPECYYSAAFNQFYGYFYIEKEAMYLIGDCRLENFKEGHPLYTKQIMIVDNPNTLDFRRIITKYILTWTFLPLFGLLYHPATYTWLLLFGLSFLIRFNQYKYLFLYIVPLTILCVCCLSPVNAFIRYSFPIVLSSFILTVFSFSVIQQQDFL